MEFAAKILLKWENKSLIWILLDSKTTKQLFFGLSFNERKGFVDWLLDDEELFSQIKDSLLKSPYFSLIVYEILVDINWLDSKDILEALKEVSLGDLFWYSINDPSGNKINNFLPKEEQYPDFKPLFDVIKQVPKNEYSNKIFKEHVSKLPVQWK